jgi:hypothetical protein
MDIRFVSLGKLKGDIGNQNYDIPNYRSVLERMYTEFQANILYSPSIIDPRDRLTFVLFGENVFTVDSVLAKVNSFEGSKAQMYTYLPNGNIMMIGS